MYEPRIKTPGAHMEFASGEMWKYFGEQAWVVIPSLYQMTTRPPEQREFIRPDREVKVRDGSYCMLELFMLAEEEKNVFCYEGEPDAFGRHVYFSTSLYGKNFAYHESFCTVWHTQTDLMVSKANIYTNEKTLQEMLEYLGRMEITPYVWQKMIVHPTAQPTAEDEETIKALLALGYIVEEPVPQQDYGSLPLSQTARQMISE